MTEFAVVGPILILLGLATLQYGLLFFAKNQINHATFMAARAGTLAHANLGVVRATYAKALIPLYGGGEDSFELAQAYGRSLADTGVNARVELLNPTRESFDDWSEPSLTNVVGNGRRVIPNGSLAFRETGPVKPASGQNIQDANLIKIRITHGYEPKVPLIGAVYAKYLQWLDPGNDPFHTLLVSRGRIPVVSHATLLMQSDAIEPDDPVSMPGTGNDGSPINPGEPPAVTTPPPDCLTAACTVANSPLPSDRPDDNGNAGDPDIDPGDGTPPCAAAG